MKTEIELAKQAGWEYADDDRGFEPLWRFAELVRADERARMAEQPAKQEPVATLFGSLPVYDTSPPAQRTWVGLTDDERDDLLDTYITAEGRARAIEAKLKQKNI